MNGVRNKIWLKYFLIIKNNKVFLGKPNDLKFYLKYTSKKADMRISGAWINWYVNVKIT